MDLIEKNNFINEKKSNDHFKSYSFYAASYYTIDPIVFLLKVDYRLNLKKQFNNRNVDLGDIFVLNPNIYFAVNPYTSLNWGIKYQYKTKDKIDGKVADNSSFFVGYSFGVSYELSSKSIINFDVEKLDTNDYDSNNITLSLVPNNELKKVK